MLHYSVYMVAKMKLTVYLSIGLNKNFQDLVLIPSFYMINHSILFVNCYKCFSYSHSHTEITVAATDIKITKIIMLLLTKFC